MGFLVTFILWTRFRRSSLTTNVDQFLEKGDSKPAPVTSRFSIYQYTARDKPSRAEVSDQSEAQSEWEKIVDRIGLKQSIQINRGAAIDADDTSVLRPGRVPVTIWGVAVNSKIARALTIRRNPDSR